MYSKTHFHLLLYHAQKKVIQSRMLLYCIYERNYVSWFYSLHDRKNKCPFLVITANLLLLSLVFEFTIKLVRIKLEAFESSPEQASQHKKVLYSEVFRKPPQCIVENCYNLFHFQS